MTFGQLLDRAIEPRQDEIVAVQNVHQLAGAALDTGVEIRRHPFVPALAVEFYPPLAHLPDDCFRIVVRRAIIDYFDLHPVRSRVLSEDTFQARAKILGAVVGRYHHRPQRPGDACRNRPDRRSLQAVGFSNAFIHSIQYAAKKS